MTRKNYSVKIKAVSESDHTFLFELLKERDPISNISHKKMPTYPKHVKFIRSHPYAKWYVVLVNGNKCGSAYLSKLNEIGLHMKKEYCKEEINDEVVKILMKKNPRQRFLVNVNPRDTRKKNFFTERGFRLIQHTYELIPKRTKYEKKKD